MLFSLLSLSRELLDLVRASVTLVWRESSASLACWRRCSAWFLRPYGSKRTKGQGASTWTSNQSEALTLAAFLPLDPATRTATVTRAAAAYPNVNYTTAPPTRATAGAKIAAATGATARTIIATPAAVPISLSLSFDPHASGSDRNALSRNGRGRKQ